MNKYLKKLLPLCCAAAFSLSLMAISNATAPRYITPLQTYASDSSISPQSDDIIWRYKVENGKTYKRKYNLTTKKWIGDWILVP